MPGIILLIICGALVACAKSQPETLTPTTCAAAKPDLNDTAHVDGYFVISDADMAQLTAYMAALEVGCIAPE